MLIASANALKKAIECMLSHHVSQDDDLFVPLSLGSNCEFRLEYVAVWASLFRV